VYSFPSSVFPRKTLRLFSPTSDILRDKLQTVAVEASHNTAPANLKLDLF
jgi:hypothetical protein